MAASDVPRLSRWWAPCNGRRAIRGNKASMEMWTATLGDGEARGWGCRFFEWTEMVSTSGRGSGGVRPTPLKLEERKVDIGGCGDCLLQRKSIIHQHKTKKAAQTYVKCSKNGQGRKGRWVVELVGANVRSQSGRGAGVKTRAEGRR